MNANTEAKIRQFFEHYERVFNRSLADDTDLNEVAALYASAFIAASPTGVITGKNDETLKQMMAQSYARYRAMGTRRMALREVATSPIDAQHCLAHVAWTGTYARKDQADVAIHFDVHYFIQMLDGEPKVFGWVSGDEEALLKQHSVI